MTLAEALMGLPKSNEQTSSIQDQILGYLNFSSGNHDPKFFGNLNLLFGQFWESNSENIDLSVLEQVRQSLAQRLDLLSKDNPTFRDCQQAQWVLATAFEYSLPAYRKYHRDLLFHQDDELLFNSFFLGRVFEAILKSESPRDNQEEFSTAVISQLNDFLGHRPVATLESQKIEPYAHEWIRPIPLYIHDAGIAVGKYQAVTELALQIIRETDVHILRASHFDPSNLKELAIDPRAFDFDHPINQRPNHHFGQWDEHMVDNTGVFQRFIIHQVTLDSLLERTYIPVVEGEPPISAEECLFEASAVLAGTILMASGISGAGPGTFDSNTTLATLLPIIAGYRDQFYDDLMNRISDAHRARLLSEAATKHQPFGGVRQNLNAQLAQRRASQLVNCRLASIFARMGYPAAAEEQSQIVPVAAARINCQIDCLLSSASESIKEGKLDIAFDAIPKIMLRLKRGIQCGAIVDPWNILGFDANYSLFPALENTVRDYRAFDLVDLMDRIFAFCSRLWSEAAASDSEEMCTSIQKEFLAIVEWWRKYAAHEVMSVDAVDAEDIYQAADLVAEALNLWHKGGAATGDIEFWKLHAELFDSPKAYSLVIDALMQRDDYKTSMALLVHWMSQAEYIPLQQGDSSFHNMVFRWILEQKRLLGASDKGATTPDECWNRIRKFYDFLEANAEEYWEVPEFDLTRSAKVTKELLDQLDEEEEFPDDEEPSSDDNDLYRAAYDDVVYTDTTNDGFEGDVFDDSLSSDDALEGEVERVLERLDFLGTLAGYWGVAATIPLPVIRREELNEKLTERLVKRRDIIMAWVKQANQNREKLFDLLDSINKYRLTPSGSDHDSLLVYDQQRLYKDRLLEQTIDTCIETENAIRHLVAVVQAVSFLIDNETTTNVIAADTATASYVNGGAPVVNVYSALLVQDAKTIGSHFPSLIEYLNEQSLLYVPLSKGGDPAAIVRARVVQTAILDLLRRLPPLGLLVETHDLTSTTLAMEKNNPIGRGAVTEFDEIFEVAYTSLVHMLVQSTKHLKKQRETEGQMDKKEIKEESQSVLFDCIEMLTESMLILWLEHSRTLRLSVVEKVQDQPSWESLIQFVKDYGKGLFTQHFLHLGNIRAILHQGVDHWLAQVEQSHTQPDLRIFDELGHVLPRPKAVRYLTLILESVIENYNEYRDYNTTTTQSDRGESLYMFIDFLRLRSRYDRVCWNLKPVVWAHRILVNDQENGVARMWRRSLVDRVGPEADKYLAMLKELRAKYSMRMASIGRRVEGRFGHQMQIDRLKALVAPSIENPSARSSYRVFEKLKQEAQAFSRTTMGVGVDLPAWLAALENEVEQHLLPQRLRDPNYQSSGMESNPIPIALLKEKLEELPRRGS